MCPAGEHDVVQVLEGPRAVLLDDGSPHQADPEAAGFHAIAPIAAAQLVEVTSTMPGDAAAAPAGGARHGARRTA